MISLVVPTFNRPDFAIRTLHYYATASFAGEILLGDSSVGDAAERIRAAVRKVGSSLRVRYVDCAGIDDRLSLHRLSTLVATKYAAFLGDDDVLFPSGLHECASYLDAHPEYVAANGAAWAFELSSDGAYGRVRIVDEYPQPDLPQSSPLERLEAHLRNYRVTLFSLHRADAWRTMWSRVGDISDRAFSAELLPCCLSPILGRSKHLPISYLMRQTHARRYQLPPFSDWLAKPDWPESHGRFCAIAGEHLAAAEPLAREQASAAIARLLAEHYIPRFNVAVVPEPRGMRMKLQRSLQRLRSRWRADAYSRDLFRRWESESGPMRSDAAALHNVLSGKERLA